jgi:hypothetical protein
VSLQKEPMFECGAPRKKGGAPSFLLGTPLFKCGGPMSENGRPKKSI